MATAPGDFWPNGWPDYPTWNIHYAPCVHCWCEDATGYEDHAKCCKCSTRMHRKFVGRSEAEAAP